VTLRPFWSTGVLREKFLDSGCLRHCYFPAPRVHLLPAFLPSPFCFSLDLFVPSRSGCFLRTALLVLFYHPRAAAFFLHFFGPLPRFPPPSPVSYSMLCTVPVWSEFSEVSRVWGGCFLGGFFFGPGLCFLRPSLLFFLRTLFVTFYLINTLST